MKVNIRNQYGNSVVIDIIRFSMSNWQNKEFQLHLNEEPDAVLIYQLTSVGFKTPNWTTSKLIWEMNPDSISHFSSEL